MFLNKYMNKKLLFLLLSISAISLCGCDSFNSSTSIPTPPISKSELLDSTNDLTKYSIYLTDSMPTKGGKLLVIPVWFTDSDNFITNKDQVKEDIDISKAITQVKKNSFLYVTKTLNIPCIASSIAFQCSSLSALSIRYFVLTFFHCFQ